jgi:DNA primase
MTVTDEIKSRIDIIEIVSETVKLRRTGKNYTGFCPFHANSRTPAFVVWPDSGTWRCFGQCNEGGDVFKFVMKKEGWDFPAALKYLAQRAGVTLEAPTPERQAEEEEYARLRALLEEAVTFYRHHLLNTPPGKEALAFLQRRGLLPGTIETFGLGYAPDSFTAALNHFTQKGYTPAELLQAGLVSERQEGGGVYDRFRHRVMFPIRNMNGGMTGFGARILRPDDVPKFLNSPQTPLFDKGRLLYGLDQARKPIRAQEQVVIVEGYLDVIVLHQGGFTNTVSPMGTALTEDQLRLLKRFTRRIVMALDADAAGEKATLRGLEVARQAMDHSDELVFDARGLLRHEARLQADLRVTTIPAGMDPDEVVLRDPQEWRTILDAAQPVVIHVMETLARGRNLEDPKIKSDIAAQVLPLVEEVPDAVERDAYRQRLARLLRVDERALVGGAAPGRSGRTAGRPARTRPEGGARAGSARAAANALLAQARDDANLEQVCLKLLFRQPELIYILDRTLQEFGLSRISANDFDLADNQLVARLLLQSLEQDQADPLHFIEENMPDALSDLVSRLREPFTILKNGQQVPLEEFGDTKVAEYLKVAVLNMRKSKLVERMTQLQMLQTDYQEGGDLNLSPYQDLYIQYNQARKRLDDALA